MSTDRELLELAAKAAGVTGVFDERYGEVGIWDSLRGWNPLEDEAQALRLAIQLQLDLSLGLSGCEVCADTHWLKGITEFNDDDPYSATCRAIVRAAAEIGKAKEDK